MIIGLGSDLCNIERIQNSLDRFGERFEQRVFTETERAKAQRRPFTRAGTYAKRFAAKEAFSKAVGTGFKRGVFMKDIGVVNLPSGAPTLALTGGARERLDALVPPGHRAHIHLTMTDDHPFAMAVVIIEALPGEYLKLTDPDRETAAESSGEAAAVETMAEAPAADAPEQLGTEAATPAPTKSKAAKKKDGTDWWGEIKAIFWLVLAVLGFHSFIAKPFYIPSESMMPGLLVGDRLVVSKYPYGWSWVSPSFHILPRWQGRLWGAMPERGDVVIVTPPGENSDYIKRVIGLPGDTIEVIDGTVYINSQAVRREERPATMIPIDANTPCEPDSFGDFRVRGPDGLMYCRLPVFRETLPNGRSYDTIDVGHSQGDDYARVTVPEGHVFLMGDNRDHSADSRFRAGFPERGLGGPVPWENLGGRAEFITFSLDGSSSYWNPISWFTALRGGRSGTSLRPAEGQPPGNSQ